MNNIYIGIYMFFSTLRKTKKLFFMILISLICTIFGMLFFSGYYLYNLYHFSDNYEVSIDLNPEIENEKVISVLDQLKRLSVPEVKVYNSDINNLIGSYNVLWDEKIYCGKNLEYDETEAKILMSIEKIDFVKDGESPIGMVTEVDGDKAEISGVINILDDVDFILPMKFFINKYGSTNIKLCFPIHPGSAKVKKLKEILDNNEGVVREYNTSSVNPFTSSEFMNVFVLIILIFTASLANLFFIIYYWVMKAKKTYKILAVCGSDRRSIKTIIATQSVMLCFIAEIVANAIFAVFNQLIKEYDVIYADAYGSYIVISLILMGILLGFSCILANNAVKTDEIYR